MKPLAFALLALAALFLLGRRSSRTDAAPAPDTDDSEAVAEFVPMAAWFPHTATFDLTTDPPTVTTLSDWRN